MTDQQIKDLENDEKHVIEYLNGEYEPKNVLDLIRHDVFIGSRIRYQFENGHIDRIIFDERMLKRHEVFNFYNSKLANEKNRI